MVAYLTEALIDAGHHVTLFATGDSITRARLVAGSKRALRLDPETRDPILHHLLMVDRVLRRAGEFDLAHFHVDYLHFPSTTRTRIRHLTTLHGRLDLPDLRLVYRQFRSVPLVSISDSQRKPLPWANWHATVYHGLPLNLFHLNPAPGKYLAFLGRISPEKRVDRAIELAKRLEMPLRIAAKVDRVDRVYFEAEIKPLLDHPLVEFIGEIGEHEKQEFLGNACALAFLIDWPEPFGLAMIEAMACGTPVISFGCGSVPEVVDPGLTGFVVRSMDEAVAAGKQVARIDRRRCRERFEKRFSAARMADDYVDAYRRLLGRDRKHPAGRDWQESTGRAESGLVEECGLDS